MKIPVIVSARGNDLYVDSSIGYGMRLNPLKDSLIKYVSKSVVLIMVASKKMQKIAEKLSRNTKKVIIIPNGIDTNLFHRNSKRSVLRKQLLNSHEHLLLSVGGLTPIKNHRIIIEAVKELHDNNYKVKLVILGEGELKDDLMKFASDLNISNSFQIIDFVDQIDMPDYYRAFDCLIHASKHEGFGNVIIESLGCGLPVICRDEGVAIDHLHECSDVKIIDNVTPKMISDSFINLNNEKLMVDNRLVKGVEIVKKKFTLKARVGRWKSIYLSYNIIV
jgi:glycosyltransferase involved in cell wall biosynthesis